MPKDFRPVLAVVWFEMFIHSRPSTQRGGFRTRLSSLGCHIGPNNGHLGRSSRPEPRRAESHMRTRPLTPHEDINTSTRERKRFLPCGYGNDCARLAAGTLIACPSQRLLSGANANG